MLEELRGLIGSVDEPDDYWVRLHSVDDSDDSQDGLDLELTLTIAHRLATRWRIRCLGVAECRIKDWGGGLCLEEAGHVTALQYTEPRKTLMFRSRPTSAARCVGKLWVSHWHAAGPWIPFERYTNCYKGLVGLFEAGHGKVADGPAFLIDTYATALQGEGAGSYVTEDTLPPRKDYGTTLATLLIDDTFVVASRFEESRSSP